MTRPAVALSLLAVLAAPRPAAADYLITFTGTYRSGSSDSYRFDGTDEFLDDLPPLLALDRLRGGTFAATMRVPDAATAPRPGTGFADYNLPNAFGLTFTLFDAAGAVVHRGTNPTVAFVDVSNDSPFTVLPSGRTGTADRVYFASFVNDVSGVAYPALDPLYSPIDKEVYQTAVGFSQDSPPSDILTDRSVPLDPAAYARFPNGGFFSTGLLYQDGDFDNSVGPNRYAEAFARYDVTGVSVAAVPEPASLALVAAGGLGLLGCARRRRQAA